MELLVKTARWEFIILIAAFGVVTLWKVLASGDLSDLLRAADGTLSPGRVQMLALTILTALQYLLTTMHDPSRLPNLPSGLVGAVGGSQLIYLGGKAWTTFRQTRK